MEAWDFKPDGNLTPRFVDAEVVSKEIASLRAENARLLGALRKIACHDSEHFPCNHSSPGNSDSCLAAIREIALNAALAGGAS